MNYSYWPKRNAPKNGKVTITRLVPEELDKPVADLMKRGYVEVKRGSYHEEDVGAAFRKTAVLTSNLGSRDKKTLEAKDNVRHYVVMERKELVGK